MLLGKLLLLFVVVPIVELFLLIELGRRIGTLETIAVIMITGVIGATLAKMAGLSVLARIKGTMAAGKMPTAELIDGVLVLIAGAVLLTPGLLTDLFGFFLLLPFGRRFVRRMLTSYIKRRFSHYQQPFQIDQDHHDEDQPDDEHLG